MTNKLISVTVILCLLTVMLIGRSAPSDPLFYFISIDPTISGFRFIMAAAMLWITFKNSFRRVFGRNLVGTLGVSLIVFGLASLVIPSVGTLVYDYLMPLDQLLLVEAGVIFSAAAFDKRIKPTYRETEPAQIPVRVPA